MIFIFTFFVGLLSGFIGTNTGGGGLISIPALIFFGLPPQVAIATNKLASLGLSTSGFITLNKYKKTDFKIGLISLVIVCIGSYVGAITLFLIPTKILEKSIAILLFIVLVFFVINKDIGVDKKEVSKNVFIKVLGYFSLLIVGFWGSFFGGGFATFSRYVLILLFGQTFIESSTTTNLLNIGIALVALSVFFNMQAIDWAHAVPLIAGMTLGAFFGARYGIKKGDRWIRNLFIIVVLLSAIKLLLG